MQLALRAFVVTLVSTLGFTIFLPKAYANEETYFIATAYYSPLPGQSHYITWTYEGDVRLNGEGVTTASWKWVFPWLLAGPKNYPFGTKIYFEWYGIGSIEDRWGAIVKAGLKWYEHDRIDIWMGYGDDGLERAIKWWKKTIKWKIVVPSAEVSLKFWGGSPIGYYEWIKIDAEKPDPIEVAKLQVVFTKAKLYNGEIDSKYESIQDELIEFQIKNGIIKSKDDETAGYFWPKTIAALRERYPSETPILIWEPTENFKNYNHKFASEIYKIILQYGELEITPESGSGDIIKLQELLSELWEYSWKFDGKYESVKDALIDLQIKIGLIDSRTHWAAGYFGNKTKTALWSYYELHNDELWTQYRLSIDEKAKLENAVRILKSKWDSEVAHKEIQKLESRIDTALKKTTDITLQTKLKYLKELL